MKRPQDLLPATVASLLVGLLIAPAALAQIPGESLSPYDVDKYASELVVPPVMPPSGAIPARSRGVQTDHFAGLERAGTSMVDAQQGLLRGATRLQAVVHRWMPRAIQVAHEEG